MKKESNTLEELRTEDTRPMVPKATKTCLGLYDDLSNFIGQNEDYQILIDEGQNILDCRYGRKSNRILESSKTKIFNRLFKS